MGIHDSRSMSKFTLDSISSTSEASADPFIELVSTWRNWWVSVTEYPVRDNFHSNNTSFRLSQTSQRFHPKWIKCEARGSFRDDGKSYPTPIASRSSNSNDS